MTTLEFDLFNAFAETRCLKSIPMFSSPQEGFLFFLVIFSWIFLRTVS